MRRRVYPPYRIGANPYTRGLVFFTVFDNPYALRNWVDQSLGTATQPEDQELVTSVTGCPGLNFNNLNAEYIDWASAGVKPLPFVAAGGVTVIARAKPTLNSDSLGSFFGTWDQSPRNGFMLYYDGDVGSADEGIAFIVAEADAYLLSHTGSRSSYSGREMTCGGNYNPVTRTTSVWIDGAKIDSDTDAGTAWLTTTTSFLQTGITQDEARYYNGDLFWVACFNRCLSDAEMAVWTTADPMQLLAVDEPFFLPADYFENAAVGSDTVTFAGIVSITGSNTATAYADSGGDVPSVPPVLDFAPANIAIGSSVALLEDPQLFPTANVGLGVGTATLTELFSGANVAVGRSRASFTLGGLPPVLIGNRYRR